MSRTRPIVLAGLVAMAAAGLAGCDGAGGSNGTGGATVPEDTTTTSTTAAPIDITTRPDVITLEYAGAVMAELDRLHTEAVASFVAEGGPTREWYEKLDAVYDGPAFDQKRAVYGDLALDGVGLFRDPPGALVTKVERLIRTEPSCVLMAVDRDFGPYFVEPRSTNNAGFIGWVPKSPNSDAAGYNSTPWSVVFDGATLDGGEPNPC